MKSFLFCSALSASLSFFHIGAFAQSFPINCSIKPSEVIEISSVISGVVSEVMVKRGQKVTAGEPILKLDTDLAKSALEVAKRRSELTAGLASAQAERDTRGKQIKRLRSAYAKRAVSLSELEEVELSFQLAQSAIERQEQELAILKAEVMRAELEVEKSTVFAPSSGIIGEDLAKVGESVSGRLVTTLTVIEPLRIEGFVPSAQLGSIDNVVLKVDGQVIDAGHVELDYISPTANLSSNTISVFFVVRDAGLTPGQSCKFEVVEH